MPSTIQIPNHAHCAICDHAIPYVHRNQATDEERTCSPECLARYQDLQRKRKRSLWTMYALMALAFVVLLMSTWGSF